MRLENFGAVPFEDVALGEPSEIAATSSAPAPAEAQSQEPSQALSDMGQQLPHWVNLAPAANEVSANAAASPQAPPPPPPEPQDPDAGADRSADLAFIAQHQATLASMLEQAQARLGRVDTFHHGVSEGYLDYASEMEFDAATTEVQRLEAEIAEGYEPEGADPEDFAPEPMDVHAPEPQPAELPPEPVDHAPPPASEPASDRSLLNATEQLANPAAYASVKSRTAESGDSWARIAKQEYGDERYAQALAEANGAKSSLLLRGQQVMLPDLSGANLRAGGAFIAADAAARAVPAHSVIDASGIDLSGASFGQMSAQAPAVSEVRVGLGGRIEPNPAWVGANGEAHIVPPIAPSAESNRLSSLGVAMRDVGMASTNWSEAARGAGGHAFNWLVQGGAADALASPGSMQLDPGIRTELRNLASGDGPYVPKTDAERGGYSALVSVPSFGLEVAGAIEGVRGLGALGGVGSGTIDLATSRGTWGGLPATPAAQAFAEQLVRTGDMVPLPRGALSLQDLGSLASSEGAEFAVIRLNGERYVVRGMASSTTIPEGSTLIGHVHPGEGFMGLTPSTDDLTALSALNQGRSVIFNESGAWRTFGPTGPSSSVFMPKIQPGS